MRGKVMVLIGSPAYRERGVSWQELRPFRLGEGATNEAAQVLRQGRDVDPADRHGAVEVGGCQGAAVGAEGEPKDRGGMVGEGGQQAVVGR